MRLNREQIGELIFYAMLGIAVLALLVAGLGAIISIVLT